MHPLIPIPFRLLASASILTIGFTLCSWSELPAAESPSPLKVFILAGQSNMQGHAHVRTLDHLSMDPSSTTMLEGIRQSDGTAKSYDDVRITYLSSGGEKNGPLSTGFGADENKIGPELTFGITMHEKLGEPILLIKTAWGGKSLHTDFRSPSAGPFEFNEGQLENFKKQNKDLDAIKAEKVKATGHYYRLMIDHVKSSLDDIATLHPSYDPEQGHELAGLVWFQGWNDMVDRGIYPNRDKPGGYDAYSVAWEHFIRDVRKDLSSPKLPFVIGVMGAGGPVDQYLAGQKRYAGIHQNFRNAMAAPAKEAALKGSVAAVLTENYWDQELTILKDREGKVRQEVKKAASEKELSRQEQRDLEAKLRKEAFSARELEVLQKGVSNAEYHYLGSAKVLSGIGRGFADAMLELLENDRS